MDNTVHALALEAREQGMTGITHLRVQGGQIRFAQYDRLSLREGALDARAAANTDATDSLALMASADQREQTRAQMQASQQFAEARTPQATVMSI
ncbi:MAG: hypothetical protein MUF76_11910 [Hydrogenophaga sp.]|nr:hypothetical protein [Hydrogenophaga sp.]